MLEWWGKKLISNSALWAEKYWQGCSRRRPLTRTLQIHLKPVFSVYLPHARRAVRRTFISALSSPFKRFACPSPAASRQQDWCAPTVERGRGQYKLWSCSPESAVALRHGLVLQHPHAGLQPQLLLVLAEARCVLLLQVQRGRALLCGLGGDEARPAAGHGARELLAGVKQPTHGGLGAGVAWTGQQLARMAGADYRLGSVHRISRIGGNGKMARPII